MRLSRLLLCTGLLSAPLILNAQSNPAAPRPVPAAPEEMIDTLRLRDAPLELVLDRLEAWTGRIILRPQSLPAAAITINITRPLPKSEAIRALESVLALNNIGVVPMGDKFLKVVELANRTRTEAPEFITGSTLELPASGRTASKVFELSYLKATDFVPQLNTMLNAQLGGAVFFTNTNAFLVTDAISNLQRIERLIADLDRPSAINFKPRFYTLEFAKASDMATRIQALVQGPLQTQVGNAFTLSADDRTNQLILISDTRQQVFFDDLVEKLDVKADPNTRNEVVYLNNATAADVVTSLTSLVTGQTAATSRAGNRTNTATNNQQRTQAQQAQGNANQANAAAAANTARAGTAGGGSLNSDFSSLLTFVADERSNAVIISGTVDDIRLIKELIGKLDILLPQVRIEVVIAEVTLTDASTSGIDSLGLRIENNKFTGFAASGSGTTIGGVASGSTTPTGFTTNTGYGQNLSAAVGLSTTPRKNNTTILSTPSIVTSHNKESYIFVGEERPVISGYQSDTTTSTGSRSTISQQSIGIKLTVTPLLGKDGSVQLDIKQEVKDVSGETVIDGNSQPIVSSRETQSFVNVHSGEIVVLGGLQRTYDTKSTSRLGPIPLIGDLFGTRKREKTRTDLIFFLRPVILSNSPADNINAFKQVEGMTQRDAILRALNPAIPATTADPSPTVQPAPVPAPEPEKPAASTPTRRGPR